MSQIIKRSEKSKVPEGAVIISKDTALNLQWKLIKNWQPKSDVYVINYFYATLVEHQQSGNNQTLLY